MGMFADAMKCVDQAWSDPNSDLQRERAVYQAEIAWRDDESIPWRDRCLQMALDAEPVDPAPEIERARVLYDHICRTGNYPSPELFETYGYDSIEDHKAALAAVISEASVQQAEADYKRHLAMREEAIREGFVKGGRCVRRGGLT